jgi:hypothetical protein
VDLGLYSSLDRVILLLGSKFFLLILELDCCDLLRYGTVFCQPFGDLFPSVAF